MQHSHAPFRWLVVVALAVFAGMFARPAQAAFAVCRGDPIVRLSNGVLVRMSVEVWADSSQIRDVTYTVHAPRGVTISSIVYTGGVLKAKEFVRLVNDTSAGTYRVVTVVRTFKSARVAVTAHIDAKRFSSLVYGVTGQSLSVTLWP